jgi:hypothetical protein
MDTQFRRIIIGQAGMVINDFVGRIFLIGTKEPIAV